MNDLRALLVFIRESVGGPPPKPGIHFEDVERLILQKDVDWKIENKPKRSRDLVVRALRVCGLDETGQRETKLNHPNFTKERAAAAVVLATSVVHGSSSAELRMLWGGMLHLPTAACINELRKLVLRGDEVRLPGYRNIVFKNFTSAGFRVGNWLNDALESYVRARQLLTVAQQHFLGTGRKAAITGKVAVAFKKYFGSHALPVDASEMRWLPASHHNGANAIPPPHFHGQVSRGEVVVKVLNRVFSTFLAHETVKIRLAGDNNYTHTWAYVDSTVRPMNVFLGAGFFEGGTRRGDMSQASILIHELTHTWARTDDHFYGQTACSGAALFTPGLALSNADNYRCFVEEAFG